MVVDGMFEINRRDLINLMRLSTAARAVSMINSRIHIRLCGRACVCHSIGRCRWLARTALAPVEAGLLCAVLIDAKVAHAVG